ncbi:VanZ family protein [Falsibacillus pallidus]|uniref:VanZ like protein n=1 Tax=Falsibacillus pallidus TaxID=493781 RepID=A0A370GAG3_9BACI|nr:VanZ family protein [Falsibacillus pallidus]RDI40029.1 VanZ like protein [Falsibacillus pallidus]
MKIIQIVLVAALIFLFTCTQSFDDLMYRGMIGFRFNPEPNFFELFQFNFTDLQDQPYIIQKIGHFSSFTIFALLVFSWVRKYRLTLLVSIGYAITTEILQLYFSRDGRFVDMFIDSAGVLAALLLITIKKQVDSEFERSTKYTKK